MRENRTVGQTEAGGLILVTCYRLLSIAGSQEVAVNQVGLQVTDPPGTETQREKGSRSRHQLQCFLSGINL